MKRGVKTKSDSSYPRGEGGERRQISLGGEPVVNGLPKRQPSGKKGSDYGKDKKGSPPKRPESEVGKAKRKKT